MPSASASHPHGKRATRRPGRTRGHASHPRKRWSADVMQKSDALDIEPEIFKSDDPGEIAASLKRSAEHSRRRKATPFQSAMSMLNFYVNRAGRTLPKTRRTTLERAKRKLREAFGRKP
ncbi:DUF3175 domain-containing protein [Burkholderia ambifaria]|jgi:hypothetical protein|uniref:DUF3175 domain-containing protein n=3 Tax=Burkholderia ambifaria TaxID=152480 RepID=A0AA41E4C9_9BURK|nr:MULTISPECIES: DUF3175 domain-containing protein [Burkholderia]ACB68770.1 conserved hypothetical protein [Burkholderia ambifaria MC40-6]EDT01339.1 conserved hypothetical protein [Burkholderia ambifaria IOP40-10]MBR8066379.1 DUF3175 domain-containing protein [Burkholderia ambifaria]MBR8128222.1 DUF3175 domain-containing protein [Burkholderia ambifaria]MBR8179596.1 DUF3175 domain-containing protein [Burkholderia ambifaria]